MCRAGFVLVCTLIAAPAFAQSVYVVGSIGAEVSRMSRVESGGFELPGGDGEALGGSLRVGTPLGDRWGLELEFARAADVEDETRIGPRILPAPPITLTGFTVSGGFPGGPGAAPISLNSTLRMRRSNPTLGASAWILQRVSDSIDLAYVGGLAFTRSTTEQETSFSITPLLVGYVVAPQMTRTTQYDVGPVVGMEAHIGLTDHVRLVPGIRLQTLSSQSGSGWLLRPGVGLGWFF